MSLPRLILIADGFTDPATAERAVAAVQAGVEWVHLRDHTAPPEAFASAAGGLVERLRAVQPGVLVSVNTRVEVAQALGAGLQVGGRGPAVPAARAALDGEAVLSFSAHTPHEAAEAVAAGADAVLFSPVFPTSSKPGHPGAGLDMLAACCAAIPGRPVYALGGVTPERIAACLSAGAYGVALLSGILHAPDPAAAAQRYLEAL